MQTGREKELHSRLVICNIAKLRFYPAEGLKCNDVSLRFRFEPSGSLELFAQNRSQRITFPMRRTDRNTVQRIFPLIRQFHKTLCRFLQVSALALPHKTAVIQCLETFQSQSARGQLNPLAVFRCLLAVNLCKRRFRNLRMFLQQPEKVAALHGVMLSGIADEQHPVIILQRELDDPGPLRQRVQSGFVDNQIRSFRRQCLRILQKTRNGLGVGKFLLFQNIHRRIGRSD